jgi:hypothetical protein
LLGDLGDGDFDEREEELGEGDLGDGDFFFGDLERTFLGVLDLAFLGLTDLDLIGDLDLTGDLAFFVTVFFTVFVTGVTGAVSNFPLIKDAHNRGLVIDIALLFVMLNFLTAIRTNSSFENAFGCFALFTGPQGLFFNI